MPSLLDKIIFNFQTCCYGYFFLLKKDIPSTNLAAQITFCNNSIIKIKHLFKTLLILTIIFLVGSCSRTSEDINEDFLKKYGGEVAKINNIRELSRQTQADANCQSSFFGCTESKNRWKDPSTMFGIENSNTAQSATIDTTKIVMPKPPEEFTPNVETLINGQGRQLPEDMFHISYNLNNFPENYGRQKLSFDDIIIPKQDAFGVRTELGEKNYQLIGNRTLQQDIDFTKRSITKDDQEISSELIKQEKQIRRRGKSKTTDAEEESNNAINTYKKDAEDSGTNEDPTKKESDKDLNQPLDNIINQVTDQISKTIKETKQQLNKQTNE